MADKAPNDDTAVTKTVVQDSSAPAPKLPTAKELPRVKPAATAGEATLMAAKTQSGDKSSADKASVDKTQTIAKPSAEKTQTIAKSTGDKTATAKAPARPAKTAADQIGVRGELEELKEKGAFLLWLRAFVKSSPAWLTSMVVHCVVLLVLALLLVPGTPAKVLTDLVANTLNDDAEAMDELAQDNLENLDLPESTNEMVEQVQMDSVQEQVEVAANNLDTSAAAVKMELSTELSSVSAMKSDMLATVGATAGGDLSGRGNPAAKKAIVAAGGGNAASENAVGLALEWLAKQQQPDGGWTFDSPNSGGTLKNGRNGAAGMALLPFLGAGMTHKEGKYKKVVYDGLNFLRNQQKKDGSLMDGGTMYSHGICSIVLGESFAMTQDKALFPATQGALNFISNAQDKVGGGWRYTPGQPGDTSAVGWQIMALKSGHMGYVPVNPKTIAGATNFLNTVQTNSGANYGYTGPGKGPATSAVGLLCRMYLGWKKDNPGIEAGTDFLSKLGPSKNNMYFNYYATQVLHHYEGDKWKKWNEVMRDQLTNSQERTKGPLEGSWLTAGEHGADRGGRLYCTSMSCMTLEVYYRHLPIYRKQASEDQFEGS